MCRGGHLASSHIHGIAGFFKFDWPEHRPQMTLLIEPACCWCKLPCFPGPDCSLFSCTLDKIRFALRTICDRSPQLSTSTLLIGPPSYLWICSSSCILSAPGGDDAVGWRAASGFCSAPTYVDACLLSSSQSPLHLRVLP